MSMRKKTNNIHKPLHSKTNPIQKKQTLLSTEKLILLVSIQIMLCLNQIPPPKPTKTCMPSTRLPHFSLHKPFSSSPKKNHTNKTKTMENKMKILLLSLLLLYGVSSTIAYREGSGEESEKGDDDTFLLKGKKRVVETDAGEVRIAKSVGGPMHIGFISMEPQSLFIPQYLDSNLILFVRRGEARVGFVFEDDVVERRLKMGDLLRIPAGSAFYIVNPAEGQRLRVICSIDKSESMELGSFQSFFIGGGSYPSSILSGFDIDTLSTAFNVSKAIMRDVLDRQQEGPIVYMNRTHAPRIWGKFNQLDKEERLQHLKEMIESRREFELSRGEEGKTGWSWRNLFDSFFGVKSCEEGNRGATKASDSYNIYDRSPDFRNDYGWSIALDGSDYSALRDSGIGVYLVNLTAGSMMAPHVNPTATEYGIVLRGNGRIQIVFPNGTTAMDTKVREGDVFWVPRYFAFCQIASRAGPFEFFGFTTSARKNRPQFLVGANSLLRTLRGPELATAFGTTEERIKRVLHGQRESVILPSAEIAPSRREEKGREEEEEEKVFGTMKKMLIGF